MKLSTDSLILLIRVRRWWIVALILTILSIVLYFFGMRIIAWTLLLVAISEVMIGHAWEEFKLGWEKMKKNP